MSRLCLQIFWSNSFCPLYHFSDDMANRPSRTYYTTETKRHIYATILSHQDCMREVIKYKGSIHYDLPHMKRKALERQGKLLVRLTVEKHFVDAAIAWLYSH
jgi:hypothetical protein